MVNCEPAHWPAENAMENVSQPQDLATRPDEIDVWWGAYAGRRLVPELVLCGAITAVLFGLAWYFREWHGNIVRYAVQLAMGALWIAEGLWSAYRLVACGYRLTTRRLLYYRGLFHPIRQELDLKDVEAVVVEQTLVDRLLGIGNILIASRDNSRRVVFEAVRNPKSIVKEIERQAENIPQGVPSAV